MSQGRNAIQEIETMTECDDINCRKCNGYSDNSEHAGTEVINLISCDFIRFCTSSLKISNFVILLLY